jgi:hypothetical protein
MLTPVRTLLLFGMITLAGCSGPNQTPLSDSLDAKPTGYLVTLNVTDGSSQTALEQRYGGRTLVFDAKSGFAMLHTNKAPNKNDPAVQSVQENAEAFAPEPKPVGEVQLDGSTSWGGGSSSWSNGIGSWGSGSSSWGSGSTSWGNGSTSWGSGSTSWGSGTVVPALPIENQVTWNQIKLYEAHRLARNFGGGIKVAVIDSGIDLQHSVFAGKLSASSEWKDYVGNDSNPQEEAGASFGHGTAVAGIILQVAPRATILPIRVLRADGTGDTAHVVAAIAHAVNSGAQIINLSMGTDGWDDSLFDICAWANSQGVRIVAAAGNNGQFNNMDSPAVFGWEPSTEGWTVGVGSVNANDQRSSFSSYGDDLYVFAPGENIWSAYPGNKSGTFTGTSFATPIYTGALALGMSEMPVAQRNVIHHALWGENYDERGMDLGASTFTATDGTTMGGRLNLEKFVRSLPGWAVPTDIQAGIYQVVNVKSNKCLDVVNSGTENGVEIKQYTCGTGDNQKWQIEPVGDGRYKLKAVHSGRVLSIGGGTPANELNGAKAIQWDDGAYETQKWRIEALGSGYRLLVNHSSKCLNVANGSTSNLAALIQQICSTTTNQQFKLKALF